jgi:uncharacterized repeat protein (TIGR01451 family)
MSVEKVGVRAALVAVGVALGLALFGGIARADSVTRTADLAVLSNAASERHAKVGEEVTFTILATNNGPEPAELDVDTTQATNSLSVLSVTCDRGISADTPFCEYGTLRPGEMVTTRILVEVQATGSKQASDTACVLSEQAIIDPNLSNECATGTVRIIGKRR